MTTLQLILLSILSGIYLERGRQFIIRKLRERRFKANLDKSMKELVQAITSALKHIDDEDQVRRQHAQEGNEMPFAGGRVCRPGYGPAVTIQDLEEQKETAVLSQDFVRAAELRDKIKAIELRDKMKER
jgi:excinuclease UvrABC helicase subunit UvrB